MSEEIVIFIYLYIFFLLLHQLCFSICWRGVCVCKSLIWRAVFRNTRQRQRGRLDPDCIRLGTGEAPSGSLEEWKEGGCENKCMYSHQIHKHRTDTSMKSQAGGREQPSVMLTVNGRKYNNDHTMSSHVI